MKELQISGVKISFPYLPYPCQISYMEKVIKSLQNSKSAILESPTGTGKTLSLLCSTLSWQTQNSDEDFKPLEHKPCDDKVAKTEKFNEDSFHSVDKSKQELKIPKIIYSTRTHKQITQIIHEFHKIPFKQEIRMAILSSRKNTCIHPQISQRPDRNDKCAELLKSFDKSCRFYKNLNSGGYSKVFNFVKNVKPIWDIEDLNAFGQENEICPYFATRSLIQKADIIFCPYNYILDGMIRNSIPNLETRNQVIIFDEAHNLEDVCRDSASLTLDIHSLQLVAKFFADITFGTVSDYQFIADLLTTLIDWMNLMYDKLINHSYDSEDYSLSGQEMLAQLNNLNMGPKHFIQIQKAYNAIRNQDKNSMDQSATGDHENAEMDVDVENGNIDKPPNTTTTNRLLQLMLQIESKHLKLVESLVTTLSYMYGNNEKYLNDYRSGKLVRRERMPPIGLAGIYATFRKLLLCKQMGARSYQFNISKSTGSQDNTKESQWNYTFNLLCMNPSVAMVELAKSAHSIIITSGTLSPLKSFSSELGIVFDYIYEAPHVISPDRLWIRSIGKTLNDSGLKFVYKNIHNLEFQDDLGELLLKILQMNPTAPDLVSGDPDVEKVNTGGGGGTLCFFPSYTMIDKYIERWKLTCLWDRLSEIRSIFVEPRDSFSSPLIDDDDTGTTKYSSIRAKKKENSLETLLHRYALSCGVDGFATKHINQESLSRTAKPDSYMDTTDVSEIEIQPHKTRKRNSKRRKSFKRYFQQEIQDEEVDQSILKIDSNSKPGLLFAVYRGKISEGIDFADNLARLVIAIGLPYPNVKDRKIIMKREYNDSKKAASYNLNNNNRDTTVQERHFSGDQWFEIQAFRALNQALGRCVRHKNDWGAILLIDERFNIFPLEQNSNWGTPIKNNNSKQLTSYTNNQTIQKLPRWVRENIKIPTLNCQLTIDDLSNFMAHLSTQNPPTTMEGNGTNLIRIISEGRLLDHTNNNSSLNEIEGVIEDDSTTPIHVSQTDKESLKEQDNDEKRICDDYVLCSKCNSTIFDYTKENVTVCAILPEILKKFPIKTLFEPSADTPLNDNPPPNLHCAHEKSTIDRKFNYNFKIPHLFILTRSINEFRNILSTIDSVKMPISNFMNFNAFYSLDNEEICVPLICDSCRRIFNRDNNNQKNGNVKCDGKSLDEDQIIVGFAILKSRVTDSVTPLPTIYFIPSKLTYCNLIYVRAARLEDPSAVFQMNKSTTNEKRKAKPKYNKTFKL